MQVSKAMGLLLRQMYWLCRFMSGMVFNTIGNNLMRRLSQWSTRSWWDRLLRWKITMIGLLA